MSLLDLDTWGEVSATLQRNLGRTLLTGAGVFWGSLMLVLMLGFGDSLERAVVRNLSGLASNSVFIWGGRTLRPYQGLRPGRWISYRLDDAEALRERVPVLEHLCPRASIGGWRGGATITASSESGDFNVMGDVPEIRHVMGLVVDQGRFLDPTDLDEERKVVVLGRAIRDELFGPTFDPVGEVVQIRGVPFTVVGVHHSLRQGDRGERADNTAHVPLSTFQAAFNGRDRVNWFALTAVPTSSAAEVEEQVRAVLAERHRVHPEDVTAIGSWNAGEEFAKYQNLFNGIRAFVWAVGLATLLTGVVGVTNILLVIVRERTREIGLRRAVGARPGQVVALVLQEAVVLTGTAGMAGIVTGVALLELMAAWVGADHEVLGQPDLPVGVLLIAASALVVAGLLAGWVPAARAAAIDPADALRGE